MTIWTRILLWPSTNKDDWYKTAQLSKIPIWSIWSHTTLKRRKDKNNPLLGKYFLLLRSKPALRKDGYHQVVEKKVKWKDVDDHGGVLRRESARQLWGNRRVTPFDKAEGENVTRKQVIDWLTEQETYGLHKPVRRRFARRKIYSRGIDYLWHANLVNMSHLVEENDEYRYLLTVIDVFSKQAWVKKLKKKDG